MFYLIYLYQVYLTYWVKYINEIEIKEYLKKIHIENIKKNNKLVDDIFKDNEDINIQKNILKDKFIINYKNAYILKWDLDYIDSLDLSGIKLKSLPESFGNIVIGSSLNLSGNQLELLPESFGRLEIKKSDLYLSNNELRTLPEIFGRLKIGGCLHLSRNKLSELPESFRNIEIGGNLNLSCNKLTLLPESFKNIKIGGILYL